MANETLETQLRETVRSRGYPNQSTLMDSSITCVSEGLDSPEQKALVEDIRSYLDSDMAEELSPFQMLEFANKHHTSYMAVIGAMLEALRMRISDNR